MRFGILGPLDIRSDEGDTLDPGGPRPRSLLALLLLNPDRAMSTERLIDALYGDEPPAGAVNALQSQVSRLRKRLGVRIESLPAGYRLTAAPDDVDAWRFEQLASQGRQTLAVGDHRRAADLLREALSLWRGPVLADLAEVPFVEAQAVRLEELRLAALQDRIEADLASGGGSELVPELRQLISVHPLSERLYGQLMRALRASGRPAEALAVYEDARRTLSDELGADPSAELSALHLELLLGAAEPVPRGVPAQLTSFVGRREQLELVGDLLTTARLVTLTGPGGVGKTRLAVEATARHPEPVCYVELAPLTDGTQLPYAVLTALGVRDGFKTAQHSDATQRLLSVLDGRELLLLLDNCEHLIEDTARLAGLLLGACPGVRVLATSREALGITGEVLCPLLPLTPRPAVALFADRAAAVRPGFTKDATAERICVALDGLPLAIELAGARLRTLTVDEIAARLDDRFQLLSRGDRTKAPRHRTLRAVVEWSWELLNEAERELARWLTVFAGSASPDAVEYVCEVPHPEDLLASLAEKSFVEVADGRYRMLESIRAFCAEQLEASGEEERVRAAHAAYFLWLAETAEPFLRGAEQLRWLERLDVERDNMSAALRRFVRTDRESALRLMAALSWFWRLRGLYGEIAPLAAELLAAVGPEPPTGLEEEYVLCVLNAITGEGDPLEPERVERAGVVMASLDRPLRLPFTLVLWSLAGGPQVGDKELARRQMGDDPWGLAVHRMGQGFRELFFAGRPQESEAAFTQALAGFRAAGDRWGAANSLDPLAMFAGWRGDRERALMLLDEALVLVQELGAPEETADLLHRRATVLLQTGDLAGAAEHDTRACELARSVGVTDKVASARRGLGDAARLSGDTAAARAHYEAALEACAANWFSVGESLRIYIGLGRTAWAEGRDDEALEWYERARARALEQPGLVELAEVAEALAESGPPERSAMLLGAAEALRGTVVAGDPDVVRVREVARAGLSPEAYEKAYRRGRSLGSAAVSER